MSSLNKLVEAIRKSVPALTEIGVGQVFYSRYYGNIVATRVNAINSINYEVYGFDVTEGLPRSNYYPRDLTLVGKDPMLHDVLEWLKGIKADVHSVNKYGIFHDTLWNQKFMWDFTKPYLKDQSEEVINYLAELV